MKKFLVLVFVIGSFGWSAGVEKKSRKIHTEGDMFYQNLVLSAQLGVGIPLGSFSDLEVGNTFDNAEIGGIGAFQIEYFFSRSFSLGFDFSGGFFQDDFFDNVDKILSNYQIFGRFLVPVKGRVFPYGKFGLGFSTITSEIEFFDGTFIADSDPGFSLALDGGVMWRASQRIGLSGGIRYDVAFLSGSEIEDTRDDVEFDPNYFSINFGVSFFFRP